MASGQLQRNTTIFPTLAALTRAASLRLDYEVEAWLSDVHQHQAASWRPFAWLSESFLMVLITDQAPRREAAARQASERGADMAIQGAGVRLDSAVTASLGITPTARVAYLTNRYPSVSHSFIRREIQALERQGFEVRRYTIRRTEATLPDPGDQAECGRTSALLDGRYHILCLSVLLQLLRRPAQFLCALRLAVAMARRGAGGWHRHLAYLAEACRLVRHLRHAGIRHIHVHFGTNPAAVARLAKALDDISYSLTVHGPDEFDAPKALSLPEKVADAACIIAISNYGRGQLMRWSAIEDWPKIKVVRCGLDSVFLRSPSEQSLDGLRSTSLVCVARLSAQKGLPLLLEAAADLAAEGLDFQLRLIGDGELRERLEKRVRELGLDRNVHFVGWLSGEDVRRELLAARAFVLPSFAEGLPVVLMEAMALGRPVVTTAIAGVPELVNPSCGWIVPSGSAAALADGLRAVLAAEPGRLRAMGKAGRERVRSQHDIDVNALALARALGPLARQEA